MEELAIFVNFVIFERYNNYFRPGPYLLYAACSFNTLHAAVTLSRGHAPRGICLVKMASFRILREQPLESSKPRSIRAALCGKQLRRARGSTGAQLLEQQGFDSNQFGT